ncbi:MAG: sigma-E processing peptidase SpoIIGA [Clostridiales bacterium]|nr:sigma-E processing peptidase SpoIIGA [Clostridiales bacterium]
MKIYVDEIFAVNMLSQLLMLYSYGILSGHKCRHGRIIAAAAAGGAYSAAEAAAAIPHILRIPLLALLSLIAFGRGRLIRDTARLMLLCVLVEGLTIAVISISGGGAALAEGTVTLFASEPLTAVIYTASYPVLVIYKRLSDMRKKYRRITVIYKGKSTEFTALYDSGNLLKYHGNTVILTDLDTGLSISGCGSYEELLECAEAFITYGTIGKSGVLPVIEPERCRVDGMESAAALAVTNRSFEGKYNGIAGKI